MTCMFETYIFITKDGLALSFFFSLVLLPAPRSSWSVCLSVSLQTQLCFFFSGRSVIKSSYSRCATSSSRSKRRTWYCHFQPFQSRLKVISLSKISTSISSVSVVGTFFVIQFHFHVPSFHILFFLGKLSVWSSTSVFGNQIQAT